VAAYNTVHSILTNPIYAGAYTFGRTTSKVSVENGRKRVRRGVRPPISECDLLIKDHHEGAAGYVKVGRDRIEKDPDRRVQGALRLLSAKFAEFHSARRVHIWLRDEGIELPVKAHNPEANGVVSRAQPVEDDGARSLRSYAASSCMSSPRASTTFATMASSAMAPAHAAQQSEPGVQGLTSPCVCLWPVVAPSIGR
jgi:hypothetical protein